MLTHHQLIAVIRHIYPLIKEEDHGRKYWVCHPVNGDKQTGPAWIPAWTYDFPQPTADEIEDTWDRIKDDVLRNEAAGTVRAQRDALLMDLDKLVTNPVRWAELDPQVAQDVLAYRRDLLDVPQQAGFPFTVAWPTSPL